MGLLDDAIREHLELKRRRGADATEISRQESDALGPVRRAPDGAPEIAGEPAGPQGAVPPAVAPWEDETTVHTPPPVADPAPAPFAYVPPPIVPPLPDAPGPAFEPAPSHAHEPDPEPAREEPAPADPASSPSLLSRFKPPGRMRYSRAREPAVPADPPTAAHEPPPAYASPPLPAHEPDIVPADEEPDPEDILEETPDFLEETPEHDRLWFEQRPPRDFNFDD
ncbi:MAG TPA: hypothetical protein VMY78_10015 [Solirubrobacteraceae bacterium]|nr:hypothetical protein [Solirubrobacteraceae bacterium]